MSRVKDWLQGRLAPGSMTSFVRNDYVGNLFVTLGMRVELGAIPPRRANDWDIRHHLDGISADIAQYTAQEMNSKI